MQTSRNEGMHPILACIRNGYDLLHFLAAEEDLSTPHLLPGRMPNGTKHQFQPNIPNKYLSRHK
jgi:hypothetical protein